uniref:UDP-N-acetylmuramoylalanine--D-glutamate ligase n=1 Tax=Candidatus Kentrum eta TaxID=2126337 RepID=A0A450UFV3_9GAMM|nr:MAG: UDP-N-acetylmuramoylalanine--D-glutamate ligase [Candidatus Kentron sp. H]VFJ91910.1 MAG: UDP-N-acetylmuramoylalanine--D-glutamate ligase [Candidatus Kentron sp. H]VFJ99743.1 MAG: UDP-N-acetylmuramoylalanine--D-glutamate ligase [Candidatus Kentron sp. H]
MSTQPIVIVGLGQTGLSVAHHLAARGIEIVVVDSRAEPPELVALRAELPKIPVYLGDFNEKVLSSAREIILSPGVSLQEPAIRHARDRGVPVIGDIELFARAIHASAAQVPVVGITGSNGKSTVTTLVAEMARLDGLTVRAGGNLGPPALALLDGNKANDGKTTDMFVLELSSFQLETTTSLNPIAATILNLSEDHMDRYADMSSYARAKYRIFTGNGVMVLNLDDPIVAAAKGHPDNSDKNHARPVIGFTLALPGADEFGVVDREGGAWIARGQIPLLPITALKLQGMHNVANALAALALGTAAGLSLSAMREALREFPGLPHRCQFVADWGGVRWFNDSKATNVSSTVAAIHGFGREGGVVLIAGGDGKGADFSPLRDIIRESAVWGDATQRAVRAVVLLGQDAPRIAATVQDVVPVVRANEMHDAVHKARDLAKPGDSVLLSPACASWDMYRDYQERGEVFTAAVNSALQ